MVAVLKSTTALVGFDLDNMAKSNKKNLLAKRNRNIKLNLNWKQAHGILCSLQYMAGFQNMLISKIVRHYTIFFIINID